MIVRTGKTVWEGKVSEGDGKVSTSSGSMKDISFTYPTRFDKTNTTNPEELIAAAHSACFSMMLAHELEKAGYYPQQIITEDEVQLEEVHNQYIISRIDVCTEAIVPGMPFSEFYLLAEKAKDNCPLSKALENVEIVLHATLKMGIIHEIII